MPITRAVVVFAGWPVEPDAAVATLMGRDPLPFPDRWLNPCSFAQKPAFLREQTVRLFIGRPLRDCAQNTPKSMSNRRRKAVRQASQER